MKIDGYLQRRCQQSQLLASKGQSKHNEKTAWA